MADYKVSSNELKNVANKLKELNPTYISGLSENKFKWTTDYINCIAEEIQAKQQTEAQLNESLNLNESLSQQLEEKTNEVLDLTEEYEQLQEQVENIDTFEISTNMVGGASLISFFRELESTYSVEEREGYVLYIPYTLHESQAVCLPFKDGKFVSQIYHFLSYDSPVFGGISSTNTRYNKIKIFAGDKYYRIKLGGVIS